MAKNSSTPGVWTGNDSSGGPNYGHDTKGNVDETSAQWNATHHTTAPPGAPAGAKNSTAPGPYAQDQVAGAVGPAVNAGDGKAAIAPNPAAGIGDTYVDQNGVGHGAAASTTSPQGSSMSSSSLGDKNSPAPTPYSAAQQQADASKQITDYTTQTNRPTINTPFGSQQWGKDANGNWTMNVGFGGQMGGAADQLQGQIGRNFSTPMDDGSAARDKAINAAYGQATSRLNPQWQQSDEQLGAQLANQGLDPNSQAYRTAMQQQSQSKNDAYSSAMNSAIGQGTAAQQATFMQNLAAREAPMNELKNLYGLLPGTGFNSAGSSQTPDYLNAQNNALQQQLLQQQITAQYVNAGVNAAGDIYKGAASDERLKQNVQRLPVHAAPGVPLATFEYKAQPGQRYMGVIAQDLERVAPQHVASGPDGIKRVSEPFRPFAIGPANFKPFGGQ